jgi:hypothetical protein
MKDKILADGCEAAAKLDDLLSKHPAEVAEELTDAIRKMVDLRERMIERRRAQRGPHASQDRRLRQVNSVISAMVGGEFPLPGMRWKRIQGARDLLKQVLAEEEAEEAHPR